MTRVLVLGGSSYVAQFALQRHLAAAQSDNGDGTVQKSRVMACTMRGEPVSSQLPIPFVNVALQTTPPTTSSHVHMYWGVDLGTMQGVRESIRHFRPDVIINCVGK